MGCQHVFTGHSWTFSPLVATLFSNLEDGWTERTATYPVLVCIDSALMPSRCTRMQQDLDYASNVNCRSWGQKFGSRQGRWGLSRRKPFCGQDRPFQPKSYAGPNACTPKGEKHMQPGYPQGSYVTEIGCATRTVKTDRGPSLARHRPRFSISRV